jgi:CubicO group peptidase (beta-lactamase class C family)
MNRHLIPLLATVTLAAPAAAQRPFPDDSAIRSVLETRIATGVVSGLVVGLLEPDGSRRYLGAGQSGTARALDARTVFEIGSITKTFTGALLAQMAEAGEVTLDQPLARLLPDSVKVPERGRPITLLDVATHTSGLPRLPDAFQPADMTNPYADYTVADLYAFLARHQLRREPEAEYEYSNLAVGLLGHALALRAGGPYEDVLRARILDPLSMNDTRITLSADLSGRLATGHDRAGRPVPNWDIPTLAGAGALRSTAADMLTYLAAQLHPPATPLGRALRVAHEARRPAGARQRVGLGWHVRDAGTDSAMVWHNGGTGGYHTFAGFVPSRGTAVVVLANSSADIDDIGVFLLHPASPMPQERMEVAVTPAVLERYVGSYELTPQFAIEVTLRTSRLYVQATGQPEFPIYASSDSTFFLRVVEAGLTFQRDSAGTVTGLVLHQNGQNVPGRKTR